MSNTKLATEVIEESKYKAIDDLSRTAIAEVYQINNNDLIKIENMAKLSNNGYCRVIDLTNYLHSIAIDPINNYAVVSVDTVETTALQQTNSTIDNTNEVFETALEGSEDEKFLLQTTQSSIVLPTNELIGKKSADFRILLALSYISNVENNTKVGNNSRYISLKKVNKNMSNIIESLGLSVSQFRRQINNLNKCKSNEFTVIKKEHNGELVDCYQINYDKGGFVLIPKDKAKSLLIGGSNNCIKLYANLLWLCNKEGRFIERQLTQSYLLELMGLSKRSEDVLKITTEWLTKVGLIEVRKEWESELIMDSNGNVKGSKPKTALYYSIVL